MLVTLVPLHRDRVGRAEATVFRWCNDRPDWLFPPAWAVMQLGTVGVAPLTAVVAYRRGHRDLAVRLLTAGVGTWAASKVIKRIARRPRPLALLPDARIRGREAAGLGYPSGHAGVAVALGVALLPRCPRRWRALGSVLVPVVGGTRIYVGAHLPLDVVSGAAMGLGIDALVELLLTDAGRHHRRPDW
jgi:undecaprenyl-diphosphatase